MPYVQDNKKIDHAYLLLMFLRMLYYRSTLNYILPYFLFFRDKKIYCVFAFMNSKQTLLIIILFIF